ncbi:MULTISPECIES: DoxX family protein [Shouchella]|uniref:DoxX family protein n=2 Tax=Shouchella TaxID=2893057 RepID=A0ABY7W9U8_9BACI|nr:MULTISPECIES: hypothetical protein [Shouchella]MED4126685.1 hypothetical protein [Shouchella miscanthi]WDF04615.1 hypothetical protein PQ477_03910 [Shouchella hunanensis]
MFRVIGLYLFSLLFFLAGVGHFIMDGFFVEAMPEWVPFRLFIVYASGIVEIALAILLIYKPTRSRAGIWTTLFLLLIFPVNVYMAFFPAQYDIPVYALWLRLPLQFVLIWWVLKVTKP